MKKLWWPCFILTLVILVSSGCGSYRTAKQTAPGHVLGLDQKDNSAWKVVTFNVVGKGLEPENALTKGEAKLMAERAAVADGYRQMVEKIRGVFVDAYTKAGYGKVDMDMISTKTQSWLRGARVVEIRDAQYGITEAHMSVNIYFAKNEMVWWPSGLGPNLVPAQEGGGAIRTVVVNPSGQ